MTVINDKKSRYYQTKLYLVCGKLWYGIKNVLLHFRKIFFAKFVQQQGQEIKSLKQETHFYLDSINFKQ